MPVKTTVEVTLLSGVTIKAIYNLLALLLLVVYGDYFQMLRDITAPMVHLQLALTIAPDDFIFMCSPQWGENIFDTINMYKFKIIVLIV